MIADHVNHRAASALLLSCLFLLGSRQAAAGKNELRVTLKFVPTEAEEAIENRGVMSVAGPPFEILSAVDTRPEPRDVIGESRGRWKNDPDFPSSKRRKTDVSVRATSDVAAWITQSLADTFRGWGTPTTPSAELALHTEVVKLFVFEENTYVAEVTLKFSLRRRDGSEIWSGIVGSGATRFGRTLKADNYNEVLSDAVFFCFSKVWVDAGFREAWAGKKEAQSAQLTGGTVNAAPSETLDPEVALKRILELKEAGFEEESLAAWVRKIGFTRALTSTDMLQWKAAGVPQAVIRAAME